LATPALQRSLREPAVVHQLMKWMVRSAREPLSASLPRKFKIAFEGRRTDHALTPMHHIGWACRDAGRGSSRATRVPRDGGGGTSIMCKAGQLLYDFLPAGEMLNVAEAIVRLFHRCGDYTHKQANRMKFLMKSLRRRGPD
jgi:ferredoxin-nitrite reductase